MIFDTSIKEKITFVEGIKTHPMLANFIEEHGDKGVMALFYMTYPDKSQNPYWILPEKQRTVEIQKDLSLVILDDDIDDGWGNMRNQIEWIKSFLSLKSPSYLYLCQLRSIVERGITAYTNADFDDRTKQGGLVYKVQEVTKAVSELKSAIKEIEEYQKKCTEEISQVSYGRGGREIGEFENPIKIERRELNES